MNHKSIAAIGYEQTGPKMPFDGPIRRDQVARDLRTVLDEIDPPIGDQEVGTTLRDEAKEVFRVEALTKAGDERSF